MVTVQWLEHLLRVPLTKVKAVDEAWSIREESVQYGAYPDLRIFQTQAGSCAEIVHYCCTILSVERISRSITL